MDRLFKTNMISVRGGQIEQQTKQRERERGNLGGKENGMMASKREAGKVTAANGD